jgi:hypothetical protein
VKNKGRNKLLLDGDHFGLINEAVRAASVKTCGLFVQYWTAWIWVETAFDDWMYLKESTFVANLASLYPKITFTTWEIGVTLPQVKFVFSLSGFRL